MDDFFKKFLFQLTPAQVHRLACPMQKGTLKIVVGTFPKDYSQEATSQGYFLKCQLPKCAIFQVCPSYSARPSAYSIRGARPLTHPSHSARPQLQPAVPQRA